MAVTLATAVRNAMADACVDLIDVGSANPAGLIRIGTAGMATILAELDFANPAFGAAAAGVATANAIADETNAPNTGTAAEFDIQDRDRNTLVSGSVGVSGEDINFNTVSITAGDTVSITSLTVTMPAS